MHLISTTDGFMLFSCIYIHVILVWIFSEMTTVGLFPEIHDPSERVRELCNYACKVDIDDSIPPKRYLRSGLEMMRMAKVYQEEGNFESAFILYTKFIS